MIRDIPPGMLLWFTFVFLSEKIPITKNAKAYEKLLVFLDQNFVSEIVKRDLDTKVKPEFNEFLRIPQRGIHQWISWWYPFQQNGCRRDRS